MQIKFYRYNEDVSSTNYKQKRFSEETGVEADAEGSTGGNEVE